VSLPAPGGGLLLVTKGVKRPVVCGAEGHDPFIADLAQVPQEIGELVPKIIPKKLTILITLLDTWICAYLCNDMNLLAHTIIFIPFLITNSWYAIK
jgi:hypothetical protein